jgi:hypothetical protein
LFSAAQAITARTIRIGVSTHNRAQEMVVIGSVVVEPTGAAQGLAGRLEMICSRSAGSGLARFNAYGRLAVGSFRPAHHRA